MIMHVYTYYMHKIMYVCKINHVLCVNFAGPPVLTVNIMKNTESSSLVVQWDEVDDSLPTTYTITWTSGFPIHSITLIEQSSYTITGLTFDTIYTITVVAANRCGQGPEFKTTMLYSTDIIGAICNIVPTITYYTNSTTIVSSGSTANSSATTTKVFVSPTTTTNFASSITYYTNSTTIVSSGSTANSSATTTKVFVSPTTTANFASSSDETSKLMFEYIAIHTAETTTMGVPLRIYILYLQF